MARMGVHVLGWGSSRGPGSQPFRWHRARALKGYNMGGGGGGVRALGGIQHGMEWRAKLLTEEIPGYLTAEYIGISINFEIH